MAVQHIRSELRPAGVDAVLWARIAALRPDDQIRDVLGVIAEQERIEACYRDSQNGIYWFTRFYIAVTKGVQRQLAGGRLPVRAAEFLKRLDISFYGYYRNALCESVVEDPVQVAWTPLLRRFRDRRTHPMVFALMGISAHITCDLPQAVLDTLCRMGYPEFPGPDSEEREVFFALNRILHRVAVDAMKRDFVRGLPGLMHTLFPRTLEESATRYIHFVREQAWLQARTLWEVSELESRAAIAEGAPPSSALADVRQLLALQAMCFNDCLFRELPLRPTVGISDIARWTGEALGHRLRRTGVAQRS